MIWYYSACKKLPPDDASGRSFLTRLPRVQLVACIRLITIDFNPIRTSSYKKGASKVFKPGYIHPGERISPYQPEKSRQRP
jgi:hypothetical protein